MIFLLLFLLSDDPSEVINFAASVDYLSVTFTWTSPSFLGVPPTLDPAGIIYYILDVRNDTDSVGGATVPHPTTTVVVNLTYPCEEYYVTIFARNRQAGDGPATMETFTLNETGNLSQIAESSNQTVINIQCAALYWAIQKLCIILFTQQEQGITVTVCLCYVVLH